MSEPLPFVPEPVVLKDSGGEPKSARDHLVDVVALEVACGTKLATIASRHGYSYNGMAGLVESEDVQQRVAYYRRRLDYEKELAQKKVLLHLGSLTDSELRVALPFEGMDPSELPDALTQHKILASPPSQKARHYLMDKVWPTITKVDHAHEVGVGAAEMEVIQSFKGLVERLRAEQDARTIDILSSPHVHEGTSALPSPLAGRQLAEESRK